jgi:hypothetical protein
MSYKPFTETGYHFSTMTTVDDPMLKAIEVDNGVSWTISIYVGRELIEVVNLEFPSVYKLNPTVIDLPVHSKMDRFHNDNKYEVIGTISSRLSYALEND